MQTPTTHTGARSITTGTTARVAQDMEIFLMVANKYGVEVEFDFTHKFPCVNFLTDDDNAVELVALELNRYFEEL